MSHTRRIAGLPGLLLIAGILVLAGCEESDRDEIGPASTRIHCEFEFEDIETSGVDPFLVVSMDRIELEVRSTFEVTDGVRIEPYSFRVGGRELFMDEPSGYFEVEDPFEEDDEDEVAGSFDEAIGRAVAEGVLESMFPGLRPEYEKASFRLSPAKLQRLARRISLFDESGELTLARVRLSGGKFRTQEVFTYRVPQWLGDFLSDPQGTCRRLKGGPPPIS